MLKSKVHDIKREQKKSFYLRELSMLLQRVAQDDPRITSVFITRVDLSADGGICYAYCSTIPLKESQTPLHLFNEVLPFLKLYKPSLRSALAKTVQSRYVPDIVFLFDEKKEKVDKMNELLDKVHQELDAESDTE